MSKLLTLVEKLSKFAVILSIPISIVALYISHSGTYRANLIAAKALSIAAQSNQIALGLKRVPAELSFDGSDRYSYDFTKQSALIYGNKNEVTLINSGQRPINEIEFEIIGASRLTYSYSNPNHYIGPLPVFYRFLKLNLTLMPGAIMHVDIRKYFLHYIQLIYPKLQNKNATYQADILVVLSPRIVGESTPSPDGYMPGVNDRLNFGVKFKPSILKSLQAQKILKTNNIMYQVYSP